MEVDPEELEDSLRRSGLTFEEAVARGLEAGGLFKTEEEALRSTVFDSIEDIARFGSACASLTNLLNSRKERGLSASKAIE